MLKLSITAALLLAANAVATDSSSKAQQKALENRDKVTSVSLSTVVT